MPAHTKTETGVGLSESPPRLDADFVSRSSRDLLLGHGLVDVVAVGRTPGRVGSHPSAGATYSAKLRMIDQFSSNPSWLGIVRRRVSASARARSWLSCLMSVEGGVAVGDQVQGGGLLGEIEGVS